MNELLNKNKIISIDKKRNDADYKLIQRKTSFIDNGLSYSWSYTSFANGLESNPSACGSCGSCGACGRGYKEYSK